MATIPKYVQEFLRGKMAWVGTAGKDGIPNVTPKGSLRILDDQHVVFADLFSLKTRQNLEQNPRVAVTVIEPSTARGYQLKGTAQLISSGLLYDEIAEELKQGMEGLPEPEYIVKIAVESVYDESVAPDVSKPLP